MECNTFEELLYRDLLIAESMEKNTLKEFPSEERKTLMQLLFPLKDRERFFYLYQDMTLEQYTAKVVTKARDLLDSDIFPYGSEIWLRLEDLAEIDKKLGKMQEHQDEQYLATLRLTIMSEEMPMAERLIAGQKYVKLGGNGDVKKFLHQLEAQCERNGV